MSCSVTSVLSLLSFVVDGGSRQSLVVVVATIVVVVVAIAAAVVVVVERARNGTKRCENDDGPKTVRLA